ncbi:MAG: sigma-70 family RNA polymerase sigma factor [Deltaproteobacteria bacterium]|nr:MAG: sigma-70 family RNA polymerase sigma factor [Deltaproteobacteria bacterium]
MDATDHELIAALKAGDAAALDTLLARYAPSIYRFGRTMCRNPEDAAEVLQETMLAVARHADRFREDAAFSTWLYTIARRACMRLSRKRSGEPAAFDDPDGLHLSDDRQDPEAQVVADERKRRLYAALGALSPDHREVILLRDIEQRTAREAAEILGIEVGAVKSRLHRARVRLREILERDETLPPPAADAKGACFEVERALSEMIEGDLPKAACNRLTEHVETCPRCRARCDALGTILASCRRLTEDPVPTAVAMKVARAARRALAEHMAPPWREG